MKIKVTDDNILYGRIASDTECPIALAIKGACAPGALAVMVYPTEIYVNGVYYRVPDRVERKIIRYDDTGQMKPFDFELEYDVIDKYQYW